MESLSALLALCEGIRSVMQCFRVYFCPHASFWGNRRVLVVWDTMMFMWRHSNVSKNKRYVGLVCCCGTWGRLMETYLIDTVAHEMPIHLSDVLLVVFKTSFCRRKIILITITTVVWQRTGFVVRSVSDDGLPSPLLGYLQAQWWPHLGPRTYTGLALERLSTEQTRTLMADGVYKHL